MLKKIYKRRLRNSVTRLVNVDLVLFDAFPGLITLILNQQQHGTGYYKHLHRSILILSCFVFYLFVLRVLWHFCCFVKLIN